MGEYSRFPLGATVVAVTTMIISLYAIIITSYTITVFDSLKKDCGNDFQNSTTNMTFFEKLVESIAKVIEEDGDVDNPLWLNWLQTISSENNCYKVIKPAYGTLIAWDLILAILFVCSIIAILGLSQRKVSMLLPFIIWLAIVIVFVFIAVIAVGVRFPYHLAAIVIVSTVFVLIIPIYHWMVMVRHQREANKTEDEIIATMYPPKSELW